VQKDHPPAKKARSNNARSRQIQQRLRVTVPEERIGVRIA
jgi:hypothetical protein